MKDLSARKARSRVHGVFATYSAWLIFVRKKIGKKTADDSGKIDLGKEQIAQKH